MKINFFFAILFAGSCVHSQNIDSVAASYCIDLRGEVPKLLLVKQNYDVVMLFSERPIGCDIISGGSEITYIKFVDGSSKTINLYWQVSGFGFGGSFGMWSNWPPDKRDTRVIFPLNMTSTHSFKFSKEHLLSLNGKLIDGCQETSFFCKSGRKDYILNFQIRITGECDCDFLNTCELD